MTKDQTQSDNLKYMTESEFESLLKQINNSSNKARDLIQRACLQGLIQAEKYDNYDRASQLYLAVYENLNIRSANQVRLWFQAFGPFRWAQTKDKNFPDGKKFRKSKSENANPFDIPGAVSMPWFMQEGFTKEEAADAINYIDPASFFKRLKNVVRDAQKALNNHTLANPDENTPEIQALVEELSTVLKKHNVELPTVKEPETVKAA